MTDRLIDWDEIHRRMEATARTIAEGFEPEPGEKKRILKERAGLLARQKEKTTGAEALEIVEFLLAKERYGIESHCICEVCPLREYTPLPGVPDFVLGLINVRGRILSVIDIRKFFDIPWQGISDLNKVIIIKNDTMEFGILADEIVGVRKLAAGDIGPPLTTLSGIREEFLKGITRKRTVVLDVARIMADKNIIVHQEA
jgi:purine-binding chemotaxis protein CheW